MMQENCPFWLTVALPFLVLAGASGHNPSNRPADVSSLSLSVCPPDTFTATLTLSDSVICPGECVRLTIGSLPPGVSTMILLPPGGQPDPTQPGVLCFPQPGQYTVTLRAEKLGDSTQFVSQVLKVMAMSDRFPNAFTPNGDGVNDTYQPLFVCPVITTNFAVYNRWGEKVFESRDPEAAWDGLVDGVPAPSDVYGWRLEYAALRDNQRQTITTKGEVTLLR